MLLFKSSINSLVLFAPNSENMTLSIFDDFKIEIESAKLHTLNGYARDLILIEKNGNFCSKQEEIINLICINDKEI